MASCFVLDAHANPTGPTVVNGQVSILRNASLLQVSNSPGSIINWQSFSIGAGEITRFVQQSSSSSVLNRVTTQNPSSILGTLQSNGRVFLINPNGIVFGAGAQVDVAGLVASSLNLSNADFLSGRLNFSATPGAGAVVSQGSITAGTGGSVYLVGPAVTNSGIITTPKGEVVLAAGNSVELVNPGTPNLRVELTAPDNQAVNLGQISADAGRVGIYAGLINHSGTIRADSAELGVEGQIILKATKSVTLEAGSMLTATGSNGANGGFIETSAEKVRIDPAAIITTASSGGATGTWLIDPNDYVIGTGGDITGAQVEASLATTNVAIVSSQGNASGGGDINVNDNITWSANTLSLTAAHDINLSAVLTPQGSSALVLNTGTANGADGALAGGTLRAGFNPTGGFAGKVEFGSRTGTGFLTINGQGYTVINSLGAQGSVTGMDLQGVTPGGVYALGTDIDASSTATWGTVGFAPLGPSALDGLGHVVSGLYINRPTQSLVGLIAQGGSIRNIGLTNANVTGDVNCIVGCGFNAVGALVGSLTGDLNNAFSTGAVHGLDRTGGLVGAASAGSNVSNSYSTASVLAEGTDAGGLAGTASGNITRSFATGNARGLLSAGGLVGDTVGGTISDSFATGGVSASLSNSAGGVGGLVGRNAGTIINSYASGPVSPPPLQLSGGLTGSSGDAFGGAIVNSYFSIPGTGRPNCNGAGGSTCTGLTGMTAQASFQGFDFAGTWTINEGVSAPTLRVFTAPFTARGPLLFTWTDAGGDFLWTNPLNWDRHSLPGAKDGVLLNLFGDQAQLTGGTFYIGNITSTSGNTLLVNGGNLGVQGDASLGAGITIQSGSLSLQGSSAASLAATTLSGGTLTVAPAATVNSLVLSGSGAAAFNGTATFSGGLTMSDNGSATFNGSTTIGGLTLSGGTLTGTGSVTLNGSSNWTGGTLTGGSGLTILGTLDAGSAGTLVAARSVSNRGTLNVNGGTVVLPGLTTNFNSVINTAPGATLSTGNAAFTNNGLITGFGTIDVGSQTLTSFGTIDPGSSTASGTLTINGNFTAGSFNDVFIDMRGSAPGQFDAIAVNGTARLDGRLTTFTNGFTLTNETIPVLTATSRIGKFASHLGTAATTLGGPDYSGGNLSIVGGRVGYFFDNDSGDFRYMNTANWNRNFRPGGDTDAAAAGMPNSAFLQLPGGGQISVAGGGSFTTGNITSAANNSLLVVDENLTITGTANLAGATTVQAAALTFQGNTTLGDTTMTGGSLALNGTTALGPTTVNGGTLIVNGATSTSGDLTNAGTLRGVGALTLNGGAGTLFNNGHIAPGSSAATGTLTVNGNVTFGAPSSLDVRLGGTSAGQYDVLAVSGAANLNGAVNATLVNSFAPAVGDSFPVLTYSSRSGTFSAFNLPAQIGHVYNAADLTLNRALNGVLWDNDAGDFLWDNALNWSANQLPTSNDAVTLNIAAGSHADVTTGSHTVGSLTSASNNALIINGGDLTVLGAANLSGDVTVQSGRLSLQGTSALGNYAQTGGGFGGAGSVTVGNSFSHTGGIFGMTGDIAITQAAGNLNLSQPLSARYVIVSVPAGSLSETGSGAVSSVSLTTTTAGGQTLGGANQVADFSATNSVSGNLTFADTGGFLTTHDITNAAPNGSVSVTAVGPLIVSGNVNTGGNASTTLVGSTWITVNGAVGNATPGGKTSISAGSTLGGTGVVTGDLVVLDAAGSIGGSSTSRVPLSTAAGTLTAHSTGSWVEINEADAVTLDRFGTIGNSAPAGYTLTAQGPITVAAAGVNTTGSGATVLTTLPGLSGPARDIVLNGPVGNAGIGQGGVALTSAGNITGSAVVTGDTVYLSAAGTIGISGGAPVNTSSLSTLNLRTQGSGAAGDINVAEANPLATSRLITATDPSSTQTIVLSAPTINVDGVVGTFSSAGMDNFVLTATAGDVAGGSGQILANDLTLVASGGIGAGSAVSTYTLGNMRLTTRGIGSAGDISINEFNSIGTDRLTLSTDSSKQNVSLTATAIDVLADIGDLVDDLVLRTTPAGGQDIGSVAGIVVRGANVTLESNRGIGTRVYSSGGTGSGSAVPDPVTVSTPGTLNVTSNGDGFTGNVNVLVSGVLDTAAFHLSTSPTSSKQVKLSADSITLSQPIGDASDDLDMSATVGNIAGTGLVTAHNLVLSAKGGIGPSAPLRTSIGGTLSLASAGTGAAGNINVFATNPLSSGLGFTTDGASSQTVQVRALSFVVNGTVVIDGLTTNRGLGDSADDVLLAHDPLAVAGAATGTGLLTVAPGAQVTFSGGSFALPRPVVNQGSTIVSSGSTLVMGSGGSFRNAAGGSLGGGGTIDMRPARLALQNDGSIAPGLSGVESGFTVLGDVTFGPGSSFAAMRTVNTYPDSFTVTGRVSLAGTLTATDNVVVQTPFTVLLYGSRTGTFTTANLPSQFSADYQADRLVITPPAPPPAPSNPPADAGASTAGASNASNQAGNSANQVAGQVSSANSSGSTSATGASQAGGQGGAVSCKRGWKGKLCTFN